MAATYGVLFSPPDATPDELFVGLARNLSRSRAQRSSDLAAGLGAAAGAAISPATPTTPGAPARALAASDMEAWFAAQRAARGMG